MDRATRKAALGARRRILLVEAGVNPQLIEAIWGEPPDVVRALLDDDLRDVEWVDHGAAAEPGLVPLCSVLGFQACVVATGGRLLFLEYPDPPLVIHEVWVWAEILGHRLCTAVEDERVGPIPPPIGGADGRVDLARLLAVTGRLGCPALPRWVGAVVGNARAGRGVFAFGPAVEAAVGIGRG
ncbi:MAG: hypothetical protein ABMB14_29415 [Myxococcota bacterium]